MYDCTIIEVLKCLAGRWKSHKRRLEIGEDSWRRQCERLDVRIETETDPQLKVQFDEEKSRVDGVWQEVWEAEDHSKVVLDTAVEWCAAHTGFGSPLIRDLAVIGFDAAWKPELESDAQKLIPVLRNLPAAIWQTTGWAKAVLSVQPKSETSEHDSNVNGGASSTPAPEAEASATADTKETANLQACERKAYYAANYAEGKLGRKLTANEVWDYWREHGFDPNDRDTENADELANYEVPDNFDTFKTQLSRGRSAFKDKRNEDRKGRAGRSVVKADEV